MWVFPWKVIYRLPIGKARIVFLCHHFLEAMLLNLRGDVVGFHSGEKFFCFTSWLPISPPVSQARGFTISSFRSCWHLKKRRKKSGEFRAKNHAPAETVAKPVVPALHVSHVSTKSTALDNTWSGIRNSSRAQTSKKHQRLVGCWHFVPEQQGLKMIWCYTLDPAEKKNTGSQWMKMFQVGGPSYEFK